MSADKYLKLRERLHAYGAGEWIRRKDSAEMLCVAQTCVDALDAFDKIDAVIAGYVHARLAGRGSTAAYWWELQEIAKAASPADVE
jgi:hypothetical protein